MSFTGGNYDFVAQVETSALEVVADVILATLRAQGKTQFTRQIGAGTVDVVLVDVGVPVIRSKNLADRFRRGNTLATFRADATLTFSVTVFGITGGITETMSIFIKDLAVGIPTTPGGLPVGVSLGFAAFDIDVGGLTVLRALTPALNVVVDFIALGIRTALAPLGLVPIPILPFADAFAQLGLLFDVPSPHVGTNQVGNGLFLAADFEAPGNRADLGQVVDIIPPASAINVAAVVSNRPVNQLLPTLLANKHLPGTLNTGGADFIVGEARVEFLQPGARPAKIKVDAFASARIKVRKGGFFGSLFGKKKKVTITAYATMTVDAGIVTDPATSLEVLAFELEASLQARVTIQSVLLGVLTILLGPFLIIFLILLSQLFNFVIKFFLPLKLELQVQGSDLTINLEQLRIQLGIGASLTDATLKMRLDARGDGRFQLDHFTRHRIAATGLPLIVRYEPISIATRALPPGSAPGPAAPGELFLGVEIDN